MHLSYLGSMKENNMFLTSSFSQSLNSQYEGK